MSTQFINCSLPPSAYPHLIRAVVKYLIERYGRISPYGDTWAESLVDNGEWLELWFRDAQGVARIYTC